MKKRVLSIFLAVCMIITLLPGAALAAGSSTSGTCGTNVTWKLANGTLTISGTGAIDSSTWSPWSDTIKSVVIKNGVTRIGDYAFAGCSNLTGVTIPYSVTSIGHCAFFNCSSLSELTIPYSVTRIGNSVFSGCSSLTSMTIPGSVLSIGSNLFQNCNNLVRVAIGNGVTSIMSYSFYGCSSLTNVTIPYSVTYIGGYAFWGCSSLTNVTIPYGVTYIDERAFWGCSSLRNVTIPDSVTNIEEGAFDGCSSLTSVTIGNGVTSIGNHAFDGCSSLTSVTIPDSVTSIEDSLFNGCSSLSSVTIADGITSIGDLAFNGCSSLTSVTLPGSVTSLGLLVFGSCDNFESINVSKNSKSFCSVDGVLFSKDKTRLKLYPQAKLNTLYSIPENVVSISSYAFVGCNNIVGIVIPVSVKSIDWHSFANCSNLKDVYYSGSQSQWKAIDIDDDNDNLLNAKIHYNYVAAPTISITTSAGHPKLSWKAVDGATKYWVYRSTDGKNFKYYDKTTKTSYTNSSTTIGTTYYYKIKAVKTVNGKDIASDYSATKSIKCAPAAPVVSISRVNGKPKLSWKAVTGATKYWIYRSTDGKNFKYYDSTTKTSYTNSGAASGTKYYYKVKAVAVVNGTNVASAYSYAKSLVCTPATPNVSITSVSGKPKLSWNAVNGADKYWIYRSTDGKNFKYYDSTTKTTYTNNSTTVGTRYYYKVKAVVVDNGTSYASAFSSSKSLLVSTAAPIVKTAAAEGTPRLSWNAVNGADKYWIYRSTDGVNFKYYDSTTKTTYTNKSVTAGTTYYYKVKAVKVVNGSSIASQFSNSVSVKA